MEGQSFQKICLNLRPLSDICDRLGMRVSGPSQAPAVKQLALHCLTEWSALWSVGRVYTGVWMIVFSS